MKSRATQVKEQLLRFILDGCFPPGHALPTIQKMARTFGVSIATVQEAIHALRKEGVVEPKRGQGVFVKYPIPMRSRGARIGILFAQTERFLEALPYPGRAVRTLRKALKRAGHELVPCALSGLEVLEFGPYLRKLKLAGLILLEIESNPLLAQIREERLPVVSMDYDMYALGVSSVSFDNLQAGFLAARHLLEQGHRAIAFLRQVWQRPLKLRRLMGYPMNLHSVEDDRMRGYRLAMREAGLPVLFEEKNEPLAEEHLHALLARRPAVTAAIGMSDDLAAGLAKLLLKLGYRIPGEFSLLGMGDAGREFAPGRKVSSIWLDHEGLGRSAAELIQEALKGFPPRRVVLPVRLAAHDSVARRRPARRMAAAPAKV